MKFFLFAFLVIGILSTVSTAQTPPIEPGVSLELAKWRAAHYSDVRYKLNLTLEKMSPVLKGTMEIRVKLSEPPASAGGGTAIVLDWRKIKGFEDRSTIANVSINGRAAIASKSDAFRRSIAETPKGVTLTFAERDDHLIFSDGVVAGENVIKLDFTSPILPSGSAITRYVDKEDGSEYIYSLFVPSDASTAFPVFDQPDLKAKFELTTTVPDDDWKVISNGVGSCFRIVAGVEPPQQKPLCSFAESKPISTYVFAFAAGPFERVSDPASRSVPPAVAGGLTRPIDTVSGGKPAFGTETGEDDAATVVESDERRKPPATAGGTDRGGAIYVRKSQLGKFKPHAAEVFRLNREAVKYFEEYFDYKFPFPKYDLVLIPEFPFGGMEHAGATFLREASIIFPQEPTKNDHISRATLIFHEAAHQWFGDTVTMRWFDDLWLKEGFATFTAYKALEKIMPEMNAWKVFYERVKQAAYQTDSTKGTTPIYQEIKNLSAAKSAYGAIVYNKAPAFLRQAEFYLGEDKFRTSVRSFLKKHEFGNAGWEDLVREFESSGEKDLDDFAAKWVTRRGVPIIRGNRHIITQDNANVMYLLQHGLVDDVLRPQSIRALVLLENGERVVKTSSFAGLKNTDDSRNVELSPQIKYDSSPVFFRRVSALIPNYQDFGYGIFLLDEKSRDYVLKNIQNETDPFLRAMMWGALWDSVREGELDPREYVELMVKVLGKSDGFSRSGGETPKGVTLTEDESTTALLLSRTGTALNYYIDAPGGGASVNERGEPAGDSSAAARAIATLPDSRVSARADVRTRVEDLLIERMRNAETVGQRITYYRAFLNVAASERARGVLKEMLRSVTPAGAGGLPRPGYDVLKPATSVTAGSNTNLKPPATAGRTDIAIPLRAKDNFDIVTRLLILGDREAEGLLADLEKTETGDDAKRYAYAARAGIGTAENKAKYWKDFTENKEISESWIEAAFGPWNSIRHSDLTLPFLERALRELPNHKRNRKIFFVNGWLGAFIGGQRSEEALAIVNKFLADNPNLDRDLRLKILENVDLIERAVKIRKSFPQGRKGA